MVRSERKSRPRPAWIRRASCVAAAAGIHIQASLFLAQVWVFVVLPAFFGGGIENPYSFRYANPYLGGRDDSGDEDVVIVLHPPRRHRELPELEPFETTAWDSQKLRYQRNPGRPSRLRPRDDEEKVRKEPLEQRMLGDLFDYVSDKPHRGKGTYDNAGTGAGGGGRYGEPSAGKDPVHLALFWLARHQNPDGSWSAAGYTARCNVPLPGGKTFGGGPCEPAPSGDDVAATGLAVLAFLGAGYGPSSREEWDGLSFGGAVANGLRWMAARQDGEGRLGRGSLYAHAVCTLALSEACRRRLAKDFAEAARKAALATATAKQENGVEGWVALGVKSAVQLGFPVPLEAQEETGRWLRTASDPDLLRRPDAWGSGDENFQRWYFAAVALDSMPDYEWAGLKARIESLLTERQNREEGACRQGSWEPDGPSWQGRGRVIATALQALALEACPGYAYRFGRW